ncbi:hypothetical protein BP6252_04284 [Coleophoma cylindrospora]|uniref:Exocyst complex protein EXO70 n=1 Tax=Coleophoma cylindrospora TaxID=1849047 RepID=A0A3D8S031_9HELO|nr:hypothetical protein BP6252_04284 [Coleophoma cylindrospora]
MATSYSSSFPSFPTARQVWPLQLQAAKMAVGINSSLSTTRIAADEEARAEVEVLNSRLEKTSQLTKKIQASLSRLESSGKSVQEAVGPILGNTRKLQVLGSNIDGIIGAIDRVRQPSDIKNNEEDIIRSGPDKAGLAAFLASVKRVNKALGDMQRANLRSNQQAVADLSKLLTSGNTQLEKYFQKLLQEDSNPVEPLYFITKDKPFPALSQDKTTRLGLISAYLATVARSSQYPDNPVLQAYASVRGPYLTGTLQNLSSASINTAKKKNPDAIYRPGTNGIGTYAQGMEGAFLAEYDNICALFSRDEWGKVFNLTCQGAISELARTIRELNAHIKGSLTTDCYLAYEIIEIMSNLSSNMESRTGELKPSFAAAMKPIRETGKSSLAELLEETRRRVYNLPLIPADGAAVPVTQETMTRLQTMVNFLRPISSIMISIGDGGWKTNAASNGALDVVPSLSSFDVGADGQQIFANYSMDTIDSLLTSLESKAKPIARGRPVLGVFMLNNASIVDRMIRTSELEPLLRPPLPAVEKWRKQGIRMYTEVWQDAAKLIMEVQYTNRGQRPPSGSSASVDSAAILKGLGSKEKDAIKKKFEAFNTTFDDLVSKHKALSMEREVREVLGKEVQQMLEPLYGRFWDRYHEVDKGKGKYVKYDKASISGVFLSLA